MHTNQLAKETSPYLLQHRHNPVDWYPWGDEAFEKARSEMKLVFLSVGYSACHWCHVMERESFESNEIAQILNDRFVSIKVDREERPDVDSLYMDAVQRMAGQGGWPLSAFLLPDGRPVYGGTYFPPDDRFGRPGFRRILETLAQMWRDEPDKLVQSANQLTPGLAYDLFLQLDGETLDPSHLDNATEVMLKDFNAAHGGFGGAPKFPQPANLSFLLKDSVRSGSDKARNAALSTLRHMASGGIFDQLGGGFHRYATDEEWLVPHFEKMLYDNALLVRTYLYAFQITGDALFRQVAEETLEYVRREMTSDEGGFYAAQDADSEGVEGQFFVWDYHEVEDVLGDKDARIFGAYYGVSIDGNWEGSNILHVARTVQEVAQEFDMPPAEVERVLERSKGKLFDRREKRVRPGLDDKALTAWNAMMLRTFVEAYNVLGVETYLEIAETNARFLLSKLVIEGELKHTYNQGTAKIDAFVDDYAYLVEALTALSEATGEKGWIDQAEHFADEMLQHFWDVVNGGLFYTRTTTELIARRKEIMDNAVPSGNSAGVYALLRLSLLLDRDDLREKAVHVLGRMSSIMQKYPAAFGHLLEAYSFQISEPTEIVLIGSDTSTFDRVLRHTFVPHKVILRAAGPGDEPPLLRDKDPVAGKPTAFVCRNYACREPVTEGEAFELQLRGTVNAA